jgi:hypothetical protein
MVHFGQNYLYKFSTVAAGPLPGWQTLPASQHGYSYVHNNPVNFIDPTGEVAWFVPIIAVGAIYGLGYLAYDFLAPQDLTTSDWQWWLGSFTGYENIRHDISVMHDPCASTGQKVWAGVDAVWNAALGMSMVHGVGTGILRSGPAAKALLQTNQSGRITLEWTKGVSHPFRPYGREIVQMPIHLQSKASQAGPRLRGLVAHEVTHAYQEFSALSAVTKPLQRLSIASTNVLGQGSVILPTYIMNPVEVHAAAAGLTAAANWGMLLGSRGYAYILTYKFPEVIVKWEDWLHGE